MPEQRATYFDHLAEDSLKRIIELASERPDHTFSESFTDASLILNVCENSSAFRDVARSIFTSLSTVVIYRSPGNHMVDYDEGMHDPGLHISDVDDPNMVLAKLLGHLGDVVKTLFVDARMELSRDAWVSNLDDAVGIRHLILGFVDDDFPLDAVLRSFEGRLQSLSLFSEDELAWEHVRALVDHGAGLERLELDNVAPKQLMLEVWVTVGNTLRELTLTGVPLAYVNVSGRGTIYDGVFENCKNLKVLDLGEVKGRSACSAINMCISIGEQLQSLSMSFIVAYVLHTIANACPNAVFRVACRGEHFEDTLQTLGPRAISVQPTISPIVRVQPDLISSAARNCTKLESVTLNLCSREAHGFLGALLSEIGTQLEELRLEIYEAFHIPVPFEERANLLNLVAHNTKSLERIVLKMDLSRLHLGEIAIRNASLIRVLITAVGNRWSRDEWTIDGVDTWATNTVTQFARCKHVEEVLIKDYDQNVEPFFPNSCSLPKLRSETKNLKGRKLCVSVGDENYDA